MKETGIIMSGNHPKLILDGIKTMTRRVIKLPKWMLPYEPNLNEAYADGGVFASGAYLKVPLTKGDMAGTVQRVFCPYGYPYSKDFVVWDKPTITKPGIKMYSAEDARPMQPDEGDRLWVRATWAKNYKGQMLFRYQYYALNEMLDLPAIDILWKPSIHLHKEDAEIWLEITEVRVELLRSISPADAMAEGGYTVEEFIKLYLKINHLPDDADPWNWAIKYKLLGMGD